MVYQCEICKEKVDSREVEQRDIPWGAGLAPVCHRCLRVGRECLYKLAVLKRQYNKDVNCERLRWRSLVKREGQHVAEE